MFPPLEKQVRSLMKMLSIKVEDLEEMRVGCRIRGLKPTAEILS